MPYKPIGFGVQGLRDVMSQIITFFFVVLFDVFVYLYLGLVGEIRHTKQGHQTTLHS